MWPASANNELNTVSSITHNSNEFFHTVRTSYVRSKTLFHSPSDIESLKSSHVIPFLASNGSTIGHEKRWPASQEEWEQRGHFRMTRSKKRKRRPDEQKSKTVSADDFEIFSRKSRKEDRTSGDLKRQKGAIVVSSVARSI
jgi:hypothetical protein